MELENRKPLRRALLSVSDKTGLVDLGKALADAGVELVATSSTAAALAEGGLAVQEVSDLTGFPEILGGRVKTLHPVIHAGLLARQDDPASMETLSDLGIAPFDVVVVNLYPFASTLASGASHAECVEMIDIGGPTLLRAAAKNYASVALLTNPDQYAQFTKSLGEGGTTSEERLALATAAFQLVANYDIAIANWLSEGASDGFQAWLGLSYTKADDLRYGENPHQGAAVYRDAAEVEPVGLAGATLLGGKPLSYNNLQDADAAWKAVEGFTSPAVAIIKHANPCGLAVADTPSDAYSKAFACDPLSAFGGVVAVNREVDADTASQIAKIFIEVVVAPSFTEDALEILRTKKNLRILSLQPKGDAPTLRPISGGLLVQDSDGPQDADRIEEWTLVAGAPADAQMAEDLQFAWRAAQYVKSNAIVLAKDGATVGVGMGQVNRVDSAKLAVERANTLGPEDQSAEDEGGEGDGAKVKRSEGAVAASDAFFPFPDGLEVLMDAGVTAVVAPGGSRNDALAIEAAKKAGVTLYFTTLRHFAH